MSLNSAEQADVDTTAQFAVHRSRLHRIATRTLGSPWSADDAVQETWLRLQRADAAPIENLEAWLTTVVSRVCIDMIRRSAARYEDADVDAETPDARDDADPAGSAMRAEDVAVALQVVLDALGPRERLALVLHDVFALPFDEIAPIVDRTPTTTRQLAARARSRVRRVDVAEVRARQGAAIEAFLAAARDGDFGRLLQVLDPDIELRSDDGAIALAAAGTDHGAPLLGRQVHGADAVARVFAGRAQLARLLSVGGVPAAAYVADGAARAVYFATIRDGRIVRIDVRTDVPYE